MIYRYTIEQLIIPKAADQGDGQPYMEISGRRIIHVFYQVQHSADFTVIALTELEIEV